MKKVFIIVLVLALLVVGASVAFAEGLTDEELAERHEEMLKIKQEQLDALVAEGVITQDEADAFIENMEERYESGLCDGTALGLGNGMFRGYGRGMGRGIGVADGTGFGMGYGCGGICIDD